MFTIENTVQASGYADKNIRECPRCHGSGNYMGSTTGYDVEELTCDICEGFGIVTIDEINQKKGIKMITNKEFFKAQPMVKYCAEEHNTQPRNEKDRILLTTRQASKFRMGKGRLFKLFKGKEGKRL